MINLTEQEWKDLTNRYSSVIINEQADEQIQAVTLLSGRTVYGYVTENRTFVIKEASELLFG
jgi:hypothetical protein